MMTKEEKRLAKQYARQARKTRLLLAKFNKIDSKIIEMAEKDWDTSKRVEFDKITDYELTIYVKELAKSKLFLKAYNWIVGQVKTELVTIQDLVDFYIENKMTKEESEK